MLSKTTPFVPWIKSTVAGVPLVTVWVSMWTKPPSGFAVYSKAFALELTLSAWPAVPFTVTPVVYALPLPSLKANGWLLLVLSAWLNIYVYHSYILSL